ncbi:MAG: hypothetical protein QFB87_04700 [Patescibacteria group bacterium]|nr:hypothetical protein [Patescibacteria group bacterium]
MIEARDSKGQFVAGSEAVKALASRAGRTPTNKLKGFAAMTPEKRRLASLKGVETRNENRKKLER